MGVGCILTTGGTSPVTFWYHFQSTQRVIFQYKWLCYLCLLSQPKPRQYWHTSFIWLRKEVWKNIKRLKPYSRKRLITSKHWHKNKNLLLLPLKVKNQQMKGKSFYFSVVNIQCFKKWLRQSFCPIQTRDSQQLQWQCRLLQ